MTLDLGRRRAGSRSRRRNEVVSAKRVFPNSPVTARFLWIKLAAC